MDIISKQQVLDLIDSELKNYNMKQRIILSQIKHKILEIRPIITPMQNPNGEYGIEFEIFKMQFKR